jgi:hypothetical protein
MASITGTSGEGYTDDLHLQNDSALDKEEPTLPTLHSRLQSSLHNGLPTSTPRPSVAISTRSWPFCRPWKQRRLSRQTLAIWTRRCAWSMIHELNPINSEFNKLGSPRWTVWLQVGDLFWVRVVCILGLFWLFLVHTGLHLSIMTHKRCLPPGTIQSTTTTHMSSQPSVNHPVLLQRPTIPIRRWSTAQLHTLMANNPAAVMQVIASNRLAVQSILIWYSMAD